MDADGSHTNTPWGADNRRRGMCDRHYQRWLYAARPSVFHGVIVPGPDYTSSRGSDLPNPWAKVAPPCPHCSSSVLVFLWANEGSLRWFCQPCKRRFDVAEEAAA